MLVLKGWKFIALVLLFFGMFAGQVMSQGADAPDPIANPEAKRGGTYTAWAGPFPKALNAWLDHNGFSGQVMGLMFEPLATLHSTSNEPIGVLAESWSISDDQKTFTFKIHPQAKWSDGKPITAEDIQFYYDVIMNPKHLTSVFRVGLDRFKRPKVIDKKTIQVTATQEHWKNFWEAAGMVAFPKHIWKDKDFNKQRFKFPVVSGPYQVKELKKNRYLLLKRRENWWGDQLAYNHHKYNFDKIRFRFMVDRKKALEAFKKGDLDVYPIYTASIWINETHFDQVNQGWVVRQRVYNQTPKGFQGLGINLRREKFQDQRVRQALVHLLNRELMNEKLMHNEYFMLNSYYPDLYPGHVNPSRPAVKYEPETARQLLTEAGWNVGEDGLLAKDGETFSVRFMTSSPDQRHLNIYVEDLKRVGIKASIEQLSQATIRKRLDQHDFDMYWIAWGAGRLRDPEPIWHSKTAQETATSNIPGVEDTRIDALIEQQKTEMDLDKRNLILMQIDARLNEIHPYVLLWQLNNHRMLYWRKFGTPHYVLSKFGDPDDVITYWWVDHKQEAALKTAMKVNKKLTPAPNVVTYQESK